MNLSSYKHVGGTGFSIAIFASLLALVSSGARAQVQQSNQPQKVSKYVSKQWGQSVANARKEQPLEYRAANMDREVALPNLPGYTGKQVFVNGLSYPNAKLGPGYYMMFNTEHTKDQVKDWWTNALKMDPWKISYTDKNTIKAHAKDGSKCSIIAGQVIGTEAAKVKGMHGSYSVYFHVKEKR